MNYNTTKINEYMSKTTVITNQPTSNTSTFSNTFTSAPHVTPRSIFSDFFSLCCPPFPSRIVAKLALMPPEPSYRILTSDTGRFVFFCLVFFHYLWASKPLRLKNFCR